MAEGVSWEWSWASKLSVWFEGHIWQCSGCTPGSVLRDLSWGYWGLSPGHCVLDCPRRAVSQLSPCGGQACLLLCPPPSSQLFPEFRGPEPCGRAGVVAPWRWPCPLGSQQGPQKAAPRGQATGASEFEGIQEPAVGRAAQGGLSGGDELSLRAEAAAWGMRDWGCRRRRRRRAPLAAEAEGTVCAWTRGSWGASGKEGAASGAGKPRFWPERGGPVVRWGLGFVEAGIVHSRGPAGHLHSPVRSGHPRALPSVCTRFPPVCAPQSPTLHPHQQRRLRGRKALLWVDS